MIFLVLLILSLLLLLLFSEQCSCHDDMNIQIYIFEINNIIHHLQSIIVFSTQYIIHCLTYSVHYTLYRIHSTLFSVQCKWIAYIVQDTLHTVIRTKYITYICMYVDIRHTVYDICFSLYIITPTSFCDLSSVLHRFYNVYSGQLPMHGLWIFTH